MPTIYATAPAGQAGEIARTLVEEELAACVNRVQCHSTYRWEGEVHDDDEEILLAKTSDETATELMARIEALHPYDVPCVERFDEDAATPEFAAWLADATT